MDKGKVYPDSQESSKINYVYNQMVCYLLENVIKSATVEENISESEKPFHTAVQ